MPELGLPELLVVLLVVVVLFGPGKLADVGGALGRSIREFRRASSEPDAEASPSVAHADASAQTCAGCGAALDAAAKYCSTCGAPANPSQRAN